MAAIDFDHLMSQILTKAAHIPGDTWSKMKKTTPFYLKGYLQTLAEIAYYRQTGEISEADAEQYVKNARYLLDMGVAHTSQVVLAEAQSFFDTLLGLAKDTINKTLLFPIL